MILYILDMHVMELCAAISCEIPTIIDGLVFNDASEIRALWLHCLDWCF